MNDNEITLAVENVEQAARNILDTANPDRVRMNAYLALAAIVQALESIAIRLRKLEEEMEGASDEKQG